jgi:hypothetical protein
MARNPGFHDGGVEEAPPCPGEEEPAPQGTMQPRPPLRP